MIDVQEVKEVKPERVPLVGEGEFFVRVTTAPVLAPGAIGPYSQAMRAGKLLNLNRQFPIDPKTGKVIQGNFKDRVRQVMKNLSDIAEMTGSTMTRVVKLNITLASFDDNNFDSVNEVMKEFFNEPYPARSTIMASDFPKGVDVGIDAMLVLL